ncbi:sporulation protein YjcZ [Paenibacillus sp. M1]|uniref:Sporulation protein YjcZ n=1 Tax=Paenibacillus haidiansis TaxID=1574488 RepID=A0ABU7VZS3_9BACL
MSGCDGGYVGGLWTSTGVILVLFILLVIVSRTFI